MTSFVFLIFCHLLYGVETRGTVQSYTQDGGCMYRDSLEITACRFCRTYMETHSQICSWVCCMATWRHCMDTGACCLVTGRGKTKNASVVHVW